MLLNVLDPNVVLRPDTAALATGAIPETRGARAVAERISGGAQTAYLAIVDGVTGLAWVPGNLKRRGARIHGVMEFVIQDDRISSINVTTDPDLIERLDVMLVEQ